jgi:hypothetical protein
MVRFEIDVTNRSALNGDCRQVKYKLKLPGMTIIIPPFTGTLLSLMQNKTPTFIRAEGFDTPLFMAGLLISKIFDFMMY